MECIKIIGVWVLFSFTSQCYTKGEPGGSVLVKLVYLENPGNTACRRPCDYLLTIWITCDGNRDNSACLYGVGKTGTFYNRSAISFTQDLGNGSRNPLAYNFTFFQGNLGIRILAENPSTGSKIDDYRFHNPTYPGTYGKKKWSNATLRAKERSNSYIKLSYQVYCKQHYYGPSCLVGCIPGDNYKCDKSTGKKLCLNGYLGPNCTCKAGHKYNCDISTGKRICYRPWYGVNCDVKCEGRNDGNSGYTCDSKTGSKICRRGWYGPECNEKTPLKISSSYLLSYTHSATSPRNESRDTLSTAIRKTKSLLTKNSNRRIIFLTENMSSIIDKTLTLMKSSLLTSLPLKSSYLTSSPRTSLPLTSSSLTSSPLSSSSLKSSYLTTTPRTLLPRTSPSLTSLPLTSSSLKSSYLTASPRTSSPLTSSSLTSSPLTSSSLTFSSLTSSPLTSSSLTFSSLTSSPLTSLSLTSFMPLSFVMITATTSSPRASIMAPSPMTSYFKTSSSMTYQLLQSRILSTFTTSEITPKNRRATTIQNLTAQTDHDYPQTTTINHSYPVDSTHARTENKLARPSMDTSKVIMGQTETIRDRSRDLMRKFYTTESIHGSTETIVDQTSASEILKSTVPRKSISSSHFQQDTETHDIITPGITHTGERRTSGTTCCDVTTTPTPRGTTSRPGSADAKKGDHIWWLILISMILAILLILAGIAICKKKSRKRQEISPHYEAPMQELEKNEKRGNEKSILVDNAQRDSRSVQNESGQEDLEAIWKVMTTFHE